MAGLDAFGTQLERGTDDGSGTITYTAIGNITTVTPPATSRETIDVTAHDSPDAWMEFLGGLKDGGEASLELNYDPTEHDTLLDEYAKDSPTDYRVVFPDSAQSQWEFKAILTGFEPEAPYDDKLTASLTFKVSGKPTFSSSGS